eukprot:1593386-Amphidinium_carterae.1
MDPALDMKRLGLAAIKHPPQRTPLAMWCKSSTSITEAECIIAATCLKRLRPHGTGDQFSTGMDLLTLLYRIGANVKYPAVVNAVHSLMD